MMKVYGKLDKALMELNYFLNNSWKVQSSTVAMTSTNNVLSFSLPPLSLPPSLSPSLSPSLPLSQWNNANSYKLLSLLSAEDQEEFDFDLRKISWNSYFIQYCLGTKRYLFNEDPANLPIARKQIKR